MWTAGVAILAGGQQGIVISGNQATGAVNGGNVLTPNRERALTGVQSTGFVGTQAQEESTDPYIDNVSLLLHGDGADNSTTIVDNSNNGLSPNFISGNAGIRTANFKYGTGSLFSDGTDDAIWYSSADNAGFNFGTGDFTIEFYARTTVTNQVTMMSFYANTDGSQAQGWQIRYESSGTLSFIAYSGGSVAVNFGTSAVLTTTFKHVAVSRVSGTVYLFVNGVLQNNLAWAGSHDFNSTYRLRIFSGFDTTTTFNGNIDELRITKGVGRYTTSFTPRASAFPDSPIIRLVGNAAAGQVGGFGGEAPYTGAFTLGAVQAVLSTPDTDTISEIRVKAITSTTAIVVYYNASTTDIFAVVVTVSGDTVTAGTPITVVPGSAVSQIAMDVLSPTLAIIVYRETFDNYLRAATISISGTALSTNTAVDVHAGSRSIDANGLVVLSPTSVMLLYSYYPGGDAESKAKTLTISGTSISPGNEFSVAAAGREFPQPARLTATTVLVIYYSTTLQQIYAKVLTAGTTMTAGAEVSFGLATFHYLDGIVEQSSTEAIAIFDENSTGDTKYAVISVAGTVPTINTPVVTTDIQYYQTPTTLSTTQFFGYYDVFGRVYTRTTNVVDAVGTAQEMTDSPSAGEQTFCLMSYGKLLLVYQDYTVGIEGIKARVVTLS